MLVDFWTYSCINCLRTLPHLEAWDKRYRKAGLVIVGVHTPEFAFEHVPSNVREATRKLGVRYPVAIDDGYHTWDAYQNDSWPAEYLIDKRGHVREIKKGEGSTTTPSDTIRTLLGEPATAQLASVKDRTPQHLTTPESYLGWERLDRYVGSPLSANVPVRYRFPREIPLNDLAYSGVWTVERQRIVAGTTRACGCTSSRRTSTSCSAAGPPAGDRRRQAGEDDPGERAEPALHAAALPGAGRRRARAALHAGHLGLRLYVRLGRRVPASRWADRRRPSATHHPQPGRGLRAVERTRHLFVREPVDHAQRERLALGFGKRLERRRVQLEHRCGRAAAARPPPRSRPR